MCKYNAYRNSANVLAFIVFICLMLIFNKYKWCLAHIREDNIICMAYSPFKLHVCFVKEQVTGQRSFANIISAGNTFRRAGHSIHPR